MSFRTLLLRHVPRFNQFRSVKCWQCGIERTNIFELFCEQCHHIQGPHDKNNYFKILEMEERFDIDQKQLTQKYRRLQSVLHPDKFTTKSDQEQNISEEFSSLVNKAYNILQTPLKRALHLLRLRGGELDEDHKSGDPELLMEIMELNEEVENADTDEKLTNLKKDNDARLLKIQEEIRSHFDANEVDKVKEAIVRMRFYNSVALHINSLMREKGIVD